MIVNKQYIKMVCCLFLLTKDKTHDIISKKEGDFLDKIDLNKIANEIKDLETSKDLAQYLSRLWLDFDAGLKTKNVDCLRYINSISKLLHKVSRKLDADKAYICGVYSMKFDRLIEDYNNQLAQYFRSEMLSKKIIRNIYKYLHKNGMTEVQTIIGDFSNDEITEEDIRNALHQLIRTNLVSLIYISEYDYYELSPEGYKYHYYYFREEDSE